MNKVALVGVLACLAISHAVPVVTGFHNNANVVPLLEKESNIFELPSIGSLIFKIAKVVVFLIKSGWSIVGVKVGAIALIANLIIWGLKHSVSIIFGAAAMFGFCKFTGKCTLPLNVIPKPLFDIGETLMYAARHLDTGISLYADNE